MHPRSTLTHEQRAALVGLFEQGFGYKSAARQVGVAKKPARNLYEASWVLFRFLYGGQLGCPVLIVVGDGLLGGGVVQGLV